MDKNSRGFSLEKAIAGEQPKTKEWVVRILSALPGLISLGGAIGLNQNLARASTDNINNLVFVDNWIPWFSVSFFALGWFTTHWIESALLKKQINLAKILFFVVLLEGGIFSLCFRYFIDNEMLNRFSNPVFQLTMAGIFLRYSTFRLEALLIQRKILFGEKIEMPK